MASSQEAVIQELLFRLASVYIDRLTNTTSDTHPNEPHAPSRRRPLKSADDLVHFCQTLVKCLVMFDHHLNLLLKSMIVRKYHDVQKSIDMNSGLHVCLCLR